MTKFYLATAALFVLSPAAFAATPASLIQVVNDCNGAMHISQLPTTATKRKIASGLWTNRYSFR